MAVIWKKEVAGRRYEVRRAGNSLRLYTNGTFHSQYNKRSPLNGSLWDLLVLPALFSPADVKRVLVLGLGGGAVVRQLLDLLDKPIITAVELDPIHVDIANRFFGLSQESTVKIITGDAIAWLKAYKGKPFDLIVDDLFVENGNDPFRAVEVDNQWARALLKRLSSKGLLVINFESSRAVNKSAFMAVDSIQKKIASGYSLSTPGYANRIAAFYRREAPRKLLSQELKNLADERGKNFVRKVNAILKKII